MRKVLIPLSISILFPFSGYLSNYITLRQLIDSSNGSTQAVKISEVQFKWDALQNLSTGVYPERIYQANIWVPFWIVYYYSFYDQANQGDDWLVQGLYVFGFPVYEVPIY